MVRACLDRVAIIAVGGSCSRSVLASKRVTLSVVPFSIMETMGSSPSASGKALRKPTSVALSPARWVSGMRSPTRRWPFRFKSVPA